MNTVTIEGDRLVVVPRGLDKLWSWRRRLEVPLAHVRGATEDPGATTEAKGLRAPGLSLPGKTSGSFHRDGEKTFWNVSNSRGTIVVELRDEDFQRLVLTVDDPRAVVRDVNNAVSA